MKILFVVGQFPKLSETFILSQITGLIDQGNTVTILAERPEGQEDVHEDVQKYNLINRTFYYDYPGSKKKKLIEVFKYVSKNMYKKPSEVLHALNFWKYGKEVLTFRHICMLNMLKESEINLEYDVIHCHFGPNGINAAVLRDLGIIQGSVYTTFHGYDMTVYPKNKGENIYDYLFKEGDKFLPISEFWKNRLEDWGCSPNRIIVHPMGIDTKKFRQLPSKTNEKIKILSIARLVEKKGIYYAIEAVKKIIELGYKVEYYIIGDGPLKKELKNQIGKYDKQIELLGWKTQEETIGFLEETDIFLAPSITSTDGDMEGIPMVLMESMAMEKQVISTYHSGIPELIKDNISGFLVPEKDILALSEKLEFVINNRENWSETGEAARVTVENAHNITRLNNKLEDIFQNKN
ncbi:TPA: glycosyltransferase [Bacillus paranthracis]|uniref:glycosyltransferase n=1 Tax=unclassified Bacillus cereus group TaxID=2750818 RepID=UPI00077A7C65|nr:hypothetical protein AT275_08495 [Bacillus cereus]